MQGSGSDRELRAQLMQMTTGYWRSQVLFAASELGVFEALARGPLPAADIAARCASSPAYTERLLNGCVACDLLEKRDGRFANTQLATQYLTPDSEQSLAHWVRFMGDCYRPWSGLAGAVRDGRPVADGFDQIARGEDYTRHIILAMHEYALGPGRAMVANLDLSGRKRMLDVGGGPGTYSILLAERFPQLTAEVLDLPPVIGITRELVERHGMDGRVTMRAGNYLTDDLGSGYDVVLLSNMLHQEDPQTCKAILRKAYEALEEGGLLVIQLAFLNSEKDAPAWAVLQSLQLLLLYPHGRAYSFDEVLAMLPETGFTDGRVKKLSMLRSESLILATKPVGAASSPGRSNPAR
jgi:predicted O-methyltransferase YrrM